MKLKWVKLVRPGVAMVMLPRAELTQEELAAGKGALQVSLSRSEGKCFYPLIALSMHDNHAPHWMPEGQSPEGSSNPEITAGLYMARVKAAVESQGLEVTEVEVEEKVQEVPTPSAYDEGPGTGEGPGEDPEAWKKYGVN